MGAKMKKSGSEQEDAAEILLAKMELDVAEALADFSRIAHLRCKHEFGDLCWFGKRKRSKRQNREEEKASGHKVQFTELTICHSKSEEENTLQSKEPGSSTFIQCSKETFRLGPRAESPSSPLECRSYMVGRTAGKPAVQMALPLEPVCKIEENIIQAPYGSMAVAHKLTVRKRQRLITPLTPASSVKVEPLEEQDLAADSKLACSSGLVVSNSVTKLFANLAPQLINEARQLQAQSCIDQDVLRPRAALTEVEKEARRLRRVQANRESARQTIRRKQILCEGLTKKAAMLAVENQGLNQRKEVLLQELCLLKDQNRHLKQQLQLTMESSGRSPQPLASSSPSEAPLPPESFGLTAHTSQVTSSTLLPVKETLGNKADSEDLKDEVKHQALASWDLPLSGRETAGSQACGEDSNDEVKHHAFTSWGLLSLGSHGNNGASMTGIAEQRTVGSSNQCWPQLPPAPERGGSFPAIKEEATCSLPNMTRAGSSVFGCDSNVVERGNQADCASGKGSCFTGDSTFAPQQHAVYAAASVLPVSASRHNSKVFHWKNASTSSVASGRFSPNPQLAPLSCYTMPLRSDMSFDGSLQAYLHMERRSSAAAMAAAEARRRRKELTRMKLSQARACRLQC